MNEPGKFRAQHLVADAPFVERARLEILDQHVGALEHLHQHRAPALGGEVEPDRALVAVDADEIGRVFAMERRAPVAHLVAGGRLDLDHVGAVIGEDLRAVGPAENPRQIDHAQSGHRAGVSSLQSSWVLSCEKFASMVKHIKTSQTRFFANARPEADLRSLVSPRCDRRMAAEPKLAKPAKGGGARRDRTADLLHAMQALSQLSYGPLRPAAARLGDARRAQP